MYLHYTLLESYNFASTIQCALTLTILTRHLKSYSVIVEKQLKCLLANKNSDDDLLLVRSNIQYFNK